MTTIEKLSIAEKMLELFNGMPNNFKKQFAHHRNEHLIAIKRLKEELAAE